jgi:hypothetical protein
MIKTFTNKSIPWVQINKLSFYTESGYPLRGFFWGPRELRSGGMPFVRRLHFMNHVPRLIELSNTKNFLKLSPSAN